MRSITQHLPQITPGKVGATAVLTWLFSAMQCNYEYSYTTDNPIVKVMLSLGLASCAVLVLSSEAANTKIQGAVKYCRDNFFTKSVDKKSRFNPDPAAYRRLRMKAFVDVLIGGEKVFR